MKYKAEIFDHYQYLYDDMEYSDHQIRGTIDFEGKVNAAIMKKAAELLIKTIPILSRIYKENGDNSYWEDADIANMEDLFTATESKEEFDRFTASRTNAVTGPQIKFCLLQAEQDSVSAVINHMVSDAAGFKQCMYLFAEIYSCLIRNPGYVPDYIIDGDRGFKDIVSKITPLHKLGLILFDRQDSNQESHCEFPLGRGGNPIPFIVSHEISKSVYGDIRACCKRCGFTVNDIILTAYFRALSEKLNMQGRELDVPIMIDMRKYLEDKSLRSLANLSSTTIVRLCVKPNEAFGESLDKLSAIMRVKKAKNLGITTFVKLDAGSKLSKVPFVSFFNALKKTLKNPKICMTNIGIIDASKLIFENSPVTNAVIYASLKYRPYFQVSVTSFNDKMTLGVAQKGCEQDRADIEQFLDLMDAELGKIKDI